MLFSTHRWNVPIIAGQGIKMKHVVGYEGDQLPLFYAHNWNVPINIEKVRLSLE
jgi:hypothetical protein